MNESSQRMIAAKMKTNWSWIISRSLSLSLIRLLNGDAYYFVSTSIGIAKKILKTEKTSISYEWVVHLKSHFIRL